MWEAREDFPGEVVSWPTRSEEEGAEGTAVRGMAVQGTVGIRSELICAAVLLTRAALPPKV